MAKYALVIANNQYLDPGLAQLRAPGQDAEDFARVLRAKEIGAFEDVKILLNQPESLVSEAIDELFAQKKAEDLLVLYFSGHGVRDEQGALYLAVTNTNRARLRSTGIKSDFIRESMDQSRSRRQVLILDCCNSGAFAQGTKAAVGVTIGTSTAFEGTGYGRVVLTATDATQFAWEGDKVIGETQTSNSLFTHFLVKGLEGDADLDGNGKITVDELYDYAYEQIVSRTPAQTPGKWSYKQQGEIVLRQAAVEVLKPAPLPADLVTALESSYPSFREAAVRQLEELMRGKNAALVISARAALERVSASDDSRRVALLAAQALEPYRQAEREAVEKAAQAARESAAQARQDGAGAADASLLSTNVYNAGGRDREAETLETSTLDIARPLNAKMDDLAQEAQLNALSGQGDRKASIAPRVEARSSSISGSWGNVLWLTLIWAISFSISTIVADAVVSETGGDRISGDWIGAAIGGALGGLGLTMILRRMGALKDWKSLIVNSIGFVICVGIMFTIGDLIGYEGGDTQAYVKGYILGGVAGGALEGLVLGLYLLKEQAVSGWKDISWICASHAFGFGLGGMILILTFLPLQDQTSYLVSAAIRGIITGAAAGLIAWTSSINWMKRLPK